MTALRITICNERFLPRFGVDRLLILLAQRLVQSGHDVSFACLRCDRAMVDPISSQVNEIAIPPGLDMAGVETAVLNGIGQSWQSERPDIVVIGGWPFFKTGARAKYFGAKSIFIDAGAVAQDDLLDSALAMQRELRRIRQLAIPLIDCVLPISDFIRETQTEPDRGGTQNVRTVLLGADHMDLGTFGGHEGARSEEVLARVEKSGQEGAQLILVLGRFESRGYKNSIAAFDLLRSVREHVPAARLLLLDAGQECAIPKDLAPFVELLGMPDDHTLQKIMSRCAAGVSMSMWEGFNLPLAEFQWLARPALVFNVGAHPEVVADPWLLCGSSAEMSRKLALLLQGKSPVDLQPRFAAFQKKRRWKNTLDDWEVEISKLAEQRTTVEIETEPKPRRIILADVSNASLDPANPGVIRVARRLCSELQRHAELELVFAGWDGSDYVFLNATRRKFLESFGGPKDGLGLLATCGRDIRPRDFISALGTGAAQAPVLFLPEVVLDGTAPLRAGWAKENGYSTAAILYDLIPIYHKELCGPNVTDKFPLYLEGVLGADAVWTISGFTLQEFKRYAEHAGHSMRGNYEAINLPGQFGEQARGNGLYPDSTRPEIRILCVSTLEPRKNHLRLLQAYQTLRERRPELPLRLVLVGNRYLGAPEIADRVKSAIQRDSSIEWNGIVDDSRLAQEFNRAAFTVYASVVEGYGLPILESLWMGRPCLTHHGGVMLELAAEGGCVTADMNDVDSLTQGMERLATDPELRAQLSLEATKRRIKSWEDYGSEVAERLVSL